MKFALFFLAEYINMVTVSALATTLFLGGWRAPVPLSLWSGANHGWWPMLWFTAKVVIVIFGFVWLRGTLPRLRYDQFMHFGWKILIPINLVWILSVATMRVLDDRGWNRGAAALVVLVPVLVILVLVALSMDYADKLARIDEEEAEAEERARPQTFPTPPMDLVVPIAPRLLPSSTRARVSASSSASRRSAASVVKAGEDL
jgi:NADH-quinone oxidoreductase subunit H